MAMLTLHGEAADFLLPPASLSPSFDSGSDLGGANNADNSSSNGENVSTPILSPHHHHILVHPPGNSESSASSSTNNCNNNNNNNSSPVPAMLHFLPPHFACFFCQQRVANSNNNNSQLVDQMSEIIAAKNNNNTSRQQPKLLPCHHSLCSDCITTLTAQHKFFLPCPICKQHFPIPTSRDYPTNWLLNTTDCNKVMASMSSTLIDDHFHETSSNDSGTTPTSQHEADDGLLKTAYCPLHDLQPLEYFCQTCDYAVCVDCLKPPTLKLDSSEEYLSTDYSSSSSSSAHHSSSGLSRHEGHSYTPLDAARKVERLKIARLAQALQMRIGEAEDANEHLKIMEQNMATRLDEATLLLNKSFDRIIERLQQRRHELEAQLSATCQQKQAVIYANRQAVSNCITSAKESADFLHKVLLEQSPLSADDGDDDEQTPPPLGCGEQTGRQLTLVLGHNNNNNNNNGNGGNSNATSLDLLIIRKQLEQQTEVVLQPFPLNTVQLEETQLLFNYVDVASEKLLRSIDNFGAIISNGSNSEMSLTNGNLLSPIDGDDTKSISSASDYLLRSSQQLLTSSSAAGGSLPIDVTVRLASLSPHALGSMSASDRLRSWSTCIVGVPQVVMLTAVDEHGADAPLPNYHDRALTVAIRDAVERVGTCDIKRASAAGFLLTYTIPKEGIFEMEICLFGMPVSSSPFVVRCYPVGTQLNLLPTSASSNNQPNNVLGNSNSNSTGTPSTPSKGGQASRYHLQQSPTKKPAPNRSVNNNRTTIDSPLNSSRVSTPKFTAPNSDDLKSSKVASSENATPRASIASSSNRAMTSRQTTVPWNGSNKVYSPATFRTSKAALLIAADRTNRMRSKSQCAGSSKMGLGASSSPRLNHAIDCPSHHSHEASQQVLSSSNKTAELEQLRNFCKRVVMLTSGTTATPSNDQGSVAGDSTIERQPSAIPHSAHFDDYLFSFGRKGRAKGEFSNIQDVCVTVDGRLIVTDSGNQCVQVFSSTGEFRFRFGVPGRNPGQLARPTGVTTSPQVGDDRIYIADYENRCVHIFNDDGRHLGRLGVGRLLGVKGICLVPATSMIVVVDNRASEVMIFDVRSHKLVSKFGSRGSQPHQLAGPHFATMLDSRFCTSSDSSSTGSSARPRIAVTDFHNHAVKVFDIEGNLQSVIGNGIGDGPGQFNAVTGLAVDSADGGTLYAADWGNSRIQVFNAGGNSFSSVVNCYSGQGLFGPQGLAVDSQKMRLIVADSGNHCIKVFRSASQTTCYV